MGFQVAFESENVFAQSNVGSREFQVDGTAACLSSVVNPAVVTALNRRPIYIAVRKEFLRIDQLFLDA